MDRITVPLFDEFMRRAIPSFKAKKKKETKPGKARAT